MFTITTISFNDSSNLELEITLEPKNRINSNCKAAITDLKRRLTSTFGNLSRQGHNSNNVKGLVFKDFTSIRPANISADKVADYPDKIFSIINHKKFQLKYVVLQGAISSADMELFLKLIMVELKNNITIEKIILRNIADINSLARLKDINFQGRIKLCIEYNEETALKQVKNILSKKENIEYILLPKITFVESNQATISTHKSDENDEINSNFLNHSSHNKSYYVSSDSADSNSTDDEKYNQSHKVEAQESITNNNTIGITQDTIDQNLKIIENNINQPNRLNLELTSPEVRMSIIKKQLNELEPEIENLQTQIKDLRDINIKLEQQNEELKLQDKALKEENKKLKQTEVYAALVLPNSNASLDKKLFDQLIMQAVAAGTWRQENDMLQVDNVSLKAENNELQANNKSLKDQNAKLTLEVGYLQDQNNKLSENIEILRTDNVSMLAVVNSLKAKEKELDVSHAETRNLKTQIEVLSELLRREQDKIFNLNSLSNNSNYSVNNTFPLSSSTVNSSALIGYNKAITNVASQPNISNQGMQKNVLLKCWVRIY